MSLDTTRLDPYAVWRSSTLAGRQLKMPGEGVLEAFPVTECGFLASASLHEVVSASEKRWIEIADGSHPCGKAVLAETRWFAQPLQQPDKLDLDVNPMRIIDNQPGPKGVLLIEPSVFEDDRGFFFESFNQMVFEDLVGRPVSFVQDNHSRSTQGVLRGLHYQLPPSAQGKLVRVTRGAAFDVVVDIRRASPRFGDWVGYELSEDNLRQLWVPEGFAHGFLALTDSVEVQYKATAYYEPDRDRSIRWDDPAIGIEWPLDGIAPIVSTKDAAAPSLSDAEIFS